MDIIKQTISMNESIALAIHDTSTQLILRMYRYFVCFFLFISLILFEFYPFLHFTHLHSTLLIYIPLYSFTLNLFTLF
jgi:hypothetical protein